MRHVVWLVLVFSVACGQPQLTIEQAADLLSRSAALSGVENLQLVAPSGCFTLDRAVAGFFLSFLVAERGA